MSPDTEITKETTIDLAMRLCPDAAKIFRRHGMGCCSCMAASAETIEDGAMMHGVDAQAIVDELNASMQGTEQ